ncbi:MAG: cadherin-like beta sandwich domain-containing protein, partial [Bacilli bacterium]|nr:cadherin-like beta sandwich domain-containing protein [Bacilli bacterium]
MKLNCFYKYNLDFIIKLAVILISFCAFNYTVLAGNLSSLEVVGYENDLTPSFDSNITNYELWMSPYDIDLNINATAFDPNAQISIVGNKHIKDSAIITINVSAPNVDDTLYEINVHKASPLENGTYSYTGGVQTFVTPYTGEYQFEAWGASGGKGYVTYSGHSARIENDYGRGAYTEGKIKLDKGTTLYIYVGGKGTQGTSMSSVPAGGYNGGGASSGKSTDNNEVGGSGGGATDVRTINGTWSDSQSLASRIMVAAGGGGGCTTDLNYTNQIQGMMGGALAATGTISCWTTAWTPVVNQTSGNAFGKGATGIVSALSGAGGGGGYYGGVSVSGCGKASGGSSFISGHTGSVAVTSQTDITPRKGTNDSTCSNGTTDDLCSKHYSGLEFYDTNMISGNLSMPNTAGTATETGHTGNGFLKITELQTKSKDNYLETLTIDNGTLSPSFDPTIETYTLSLSKYDQNFTIDATLSDAENATVTGLDYFEIDAGETKTVELLVTSESGDVRVYNIAATRANLNPGEHSTLLKKLIINNEKSSLDPIFHPEKTNYEVSILESDIDLSISAEPFDENATISIINDKHIKGYTGNVTLKVSEEHCEDTIYTLTYVKDNKNISGYTFDYTGEYQVFEAPYSATYKAELWGASGGNVYATYISSWPGQENLHGKGGYTAGEIQLNKGDKLYVFVGEAGMKPSGLSATVHGGWNGGGKSLPSSDSDDYAGTGGGATDIRLSPTSSKTIWNEFDSLKTRIMVAGGGGGSAVARYNNYSAGMHAGGLSISGKLSNWNTEWTPVVNQTRGYKFGIGADGCQSYLSAGGGGGGYYGGVQKGDSSDSGRSSGGSSYISGHTGCNSISQTSTSSNIIHTASSIHYSGIKFENTKMVDGAGYNWTTARTTQSGMPTIDGNSTEMGHDGNGYAKFSVAKLYSKDNYLSLIQTNKGVWDKEFDPLVQDYTITLENEDFDILVEARPSNDYAEISGIGTHNIPADINNDPQGPTNIDITVTSENGDVKIYTLHVTRQPNSNKYPKDIVISGLIPSYCEKDEEYCQINPAKFNQNVTDYELTIPYKIKEIFFNVEKNHLYQDVNGEGSVSVKPNSNLFTVVITSEDKSGFSLYNYYVTRDMTGDNDLSILNVLYPNIDLNFDPDITEYYFNVPNNVDKYVLNSSNTYNSSIEDTMQLYYETDDTNAQSFMLGDGNLKIGQNVIPIMVVAQNGETQTYTLNVYREQNSNIYLNSLEVKSTDDTINYDLVPEFNKINFGKYKVVVPKEISEVKLLATAESATTTVAGTGTKSLDKGDNIFEIITTSQSGDVETYIINIIREKDNNTNISSLIVNIDDVTTAYSPSFDPDTIEYSLTTPIGADEVDFQLTLESELSTYELLDDNIIRVGTNLKRILVKAEDNTTKTYYVSIYRPADTNNKLSSLRVSNDVQEFSLYPEFDAEANYDHFSLIVENEVSWVNVHAEKYSNQAVITGNGKYNLTVGLNEILIKVKSESGDDKVYQINITRKPSSNAYLKLITTNVGVLVPTFDKEELNYSINVANNVESINVFGTPEVKTTTVTGNRTYSLVAGENNIVLTTLAQDNATTLTYNIKVIRDESNNTNLSDLYLKEAKLSPDFDKNIIEYTAKVPYDVENVNVVYETENNDATVEISGNTNLVVGENNVLVKVTAQDESEKTYTIRVIRQEMSEFSTYLSSLTISDGSLDPTFNKTNQFYEVEVPYTTTQITLNGISEDENATVEGNGTHDLHTGNNLFTIRVTGQDDKIRDYQILVNRLKNDEARLSNVAINKMSINFDKDIYTYDVITKDNSLDFTTITPMDPNATYVIDGNAWKDMGNYVVKIIVTAENGTSIKEYIFNVERIESDNANLIYLDVENYSIAPEFNKNILNYDLETQVDNEISSVNIIATTEDTHASISGDGLRSLNVGDNYLHIDVTSEDGTLKRYTVYVYRKGSDNNKIDVLEVLNGVMLPSYDENTSIYEVRVPYEETSLNLNIVLSDPNATYAVYSNSNFREEGNNIVRIVVTSESGKTRTILLNVYRNEAISALLTDIEIENYKVLPNFDRYTFNYNVIVDYEVEQLSFKNIKMLDKQGTYTINGNENFSVGNNTVTINTSSRDNTKHETYTLNVIRQSYVNNFLSQLQISEGEFTPEFDKYTLTYDVYVGNDIENITLSAIPEDENSVVTGLGEIPLITGKNELVIGVTNSGVRRNYTINVYKEDENNNYLISLIAKVNNTTQILSPEFDSKTYEYAINVPASTDKINLIGTISDGATVTGLGNRDISLGNNTLEIIVKSKSNKERKYTLNIYRPISNNADVLSIIPSSGTLSPTFDNTVKTYNLYVKSNVDKLSFTVNKSDKFASVEGEEELALPVGTSQRKVIVTAEDNTTKNEYTFIITRDRPDNADLLQLYVKNYDFEEEYDPNIFTYHLTVPNSKTVLTPDDVVAISQDSNAKITKQSQINLSTKTENEYLVSVTSCDKSVTNEYKIIITREKSNLTQLDTLTSDRGRLAPTFNPANRVYNLFVYEDETEVVLDATTSSDDIKILSGIGKVVLTEENTEHKIVIQAEDGTIEFYTVNIHRNIKTDEGLNDLGLNYDENLEYLDSEFVLSPTFETNTLSYTINVPYEYNILDVYYEEQNSQQIVKIIVDDEEVEDYELLVGENNIQVEVYDGLGKHTKTYNLKVIRAKSRNTYLKQLNIEGYQLEPAFNKYIQEYYIRVPASVTDLDIEDIIAIPEDPLSRVTISGYRYLVEGLNDLTVEVVSDSRTVREYIVHVIRGEDKLSDLKNITVSTGKFWQLSPKFKSNIYDYSVAIPGIYTKATVEAVVDDSDQIVIVGTGEYSLTVGNNVVTLTSTSNITGQVSIYTINIIKEADEDVDLISLSALEGTLSPKFDRSTNKYTMNVGEDVDELTLSYTTSAKTAKVYVVGNQNFVSGENKVNVVVTNYEGTKTKTYQIIATKAKNSNANLSSIKVYNIIDENEVIYPLDPEFNTLEHTYNVEVDYDVDRVIIEAKTVKATTTVVGSGETYLNYGNNQIVLTSTAENGNTVIYYVNIYRNYDLNLENIVVSQGRLSPTFDSDEVNYIVDVPYEVEQITILGIPSSNDVIVTGNNTYSLSIDDNYFDLVVKAPDNKTKTYHIKVIRGRERNNYIKELQVNGIISPTFDKLITSYDVDVRPNVDELDLDIILESVNATYEIIDNHLSEDNNPNRVTIRVTAQNGDTRDYKLDVMVRDWTYFSNRLRDLQVNHGQLT